MSISTEIDRLTAAKSGIKQAIESKNVTVPSTTRLDGMAALIASIQTGSGSGGSTGTVTKKDINFYDYDGTLIDSWTLDELQGKSALPDNPSHSGLTAQGWNWTLSNLKSTNRKMNVGQMYETESGLTEFDIAVTRITGKTVTCLMAGAKNWGDGTTDNLTSHTYDDYGDYTISCDGTALPAASSSGYGLIFVTGAGQPGQFLCTDVRLGSNITLIGNRSFLELLSLRTITLHDGITSIGSHAFNGCSSLQSISVPDGVTELPASGFINCSALQSVSFPASVTSIRDYALSNCPALSDVSFPDGVASIGMRAFYGDYALLNISGLSGVTSIGAMAFAGCKRLTEYDFSGCTAIPTLTNTNSFTDINGICKILVPASLYDQWIAATNWTAYADYIYAV